MIVYLLGFAVSTALIALTEKKQRALFCFGAFFALMIPCMIAALRSDNVGTDIQVYILKLMDSATNAPNLGAYLDDYWYIGYRNQYVADYEYGFSLLLYAVTKVTHSVPAVLFVIQAVTVVPIFLALARNRKNEPVWLGLLVYYLLFFNASLNAMRQFMAMGILLLAFRFLLEKRYIPTLLLTVLSVMFHYSGLLVVPIYCVYGILNLRRDFLFQQNNIKFSGKTAVALLISLCAFGLLLNLNLVLKLLSTLGLNRFSNYLTGNKFRILVNQIIMRLPLIGLFVLNWRYLKAHSKTAIFYLAMLLLDMVAAQLISVDTFAFRISQYFLMYLIFAAPALYACRKQGIARNISILLLIAYLLFYWYYNYVVQLRHGTVPYEFRTFP